LSLPSGIAYSTSASQQGCRLETKEKNPYRSNGIVKRGDLKHARPEEEVSSKRVQCENRGRGLTRSKDESTKCKMLGKGKDEDFDDMSY